MNASEALAKLGRLGVPVIDTADAAAALRQSPFAASKTLTRLAQSGLVHRLRKGTWALEVEIDPLRLVSYLTAPLPSYVSLQTALYLHGAIEQIPETVYAVSLARTQRMTTTVRTFSFHHVAPEVFGGFETTARGVDLASLEKALFDTAYLSGGRSRLFRALPELEVPRSFRRAEVNRWIRKIPTARTRSLVKKRLAEWLGP
jgi:predicted transcriptional regulator of viral defense system